MGRKTGLLPQLSFSVLFALSIKPRHGYELLRQIEEDSGGRIKVGPGALYGTLQRLSAEHFVEAMPFEDQRRHYYRLTHRGWEQLAEEVTYYKRVTGLSRGRGL